MAAIKGRAEFSRYMQQLPGEFRKVLRGAARAAANVVAEEARARCISKEVRDSIKTAVRSTDANVVAKVQTKGEGAYLAPWVEYGTDEHFVSVDDSQREGMSVGRINRLDKAARKEGRGGPGASLVINGQFVGTTVHHPGARPNPFLRPALDTKGAEALAAAQGYINARVTRAGIVGADELRDSE